MRTIRPFQVLCANQKFTIFFTLFTIKFVNRHKHKLTNILKIARLIIALKEQINIWILSGFVNFKIFSWQMSAMLLNLKCSLTGDRAMPGST